MKTLVALFLAIACILCLAVVCTAEEPSNTEPPVSEETAPPSEETTPPSDVVSPPPSTENTEEVEKTPEEPASFTFVDWVYDNLDKIFTGTGLAASLVVAYFFKKKLLPSVGVFVTQIMGIVKEIKENASDSAFMQNEEIKKFFDKVSPTLDEVHQNADACKKALDLVEQSKNEKEAMTIAMQEMSSVLLAMIESSRLPESVKEKARLSEINTKKLVDSLRASCDAEIPSESANQP